MCEKCGICRNFINKTETVYLLKDTQTLYSNFSFQAFIANILEVEATAMFDEQSICSNCYNLVNEIDNFRENFNRSCQRLKEYLYAGEQVKEIFVERKETKKDKFSKRQHILTNDNTQCLELLATEVTSEKHKGLCQKSKPNDLEHFLNDSATLTDRCAPITRNVRPKSFKTPCELKKHAITHASPKSYVCEICGQSYKTKRSLKVHLGMHNGVHPFVCSHCNKSFTQKITLVRHLPIHTGEAPYQCDLCGKRFIHHTSFRLHKMLHNGQRDVKCDTCDMTFVSTSHLKRHSKVHTGEKNFACKICGRRFAEKYNLVTHEKLHQNSKIGRNHRCDICSVTFSRKLNLEDHLIKYHQKVANTGDGIGYSCG